MFAVIATLIYPFVFLVTREPEEPSGGDGPAIRFRAYWRLLAGNRAFWVLMVAGCVAFVCAVALGKSVLYYFKYYLENEPASRYALMAMSASGLLIIPAWVLATKYLGKRNTWLTAVVWGLTCLFIFWFVDIVSPVWMTIWLIVTGISSLGLSLTFWSMLPDTVEYGEWVTGERTESFIFGLGQFFLKTALGIGAGVFGWLLDLAGYVPNVPQSASTLEGLKAIMILLPATGLILAGAFMWFYPLRKGGHETIVHELALRRQPVTAETQGA
jgi:GPH family glycoside/pentoside/hexuronide:cation symporter